MSDAATLEAPAESEEKKGKQGRASLPNYMEVKELTPGSLEDLPSDYVFGKFIGLKESDFSDSLYFAQYKVWHHKQRLAKIQEDVDEAEATLEDLRKYDTKEKREKAAKARRAQTRLEAAMRELMEEDIDCSDILSNIAENLESE